MASFGIDFGLLQQQANPGNALMAGYQQGRATRRQMETDRAMAAHAQGDPDAIRRLAQFDPQLAAQLENTEYQRSERARVGEARGALSDYIQAGPLPGAGPRSQPAPSGGALSGFAQPTSTLNPAAPQAGAQPGQNALAGVSALSQPNALAIPSQGAPPQANARQPNALLPAGMYDAAPPPSARGPSDAPAQSDPRRDAFSRLAQADPETAMKVQKMDAEQRAALAEALGKQMDIGGRVYNAVLQAPPEQQNAVYQQFRAEIEGAGVMDLPDAWDPVAAKSRMRMGMTVLQAVGADDRVRRTDWDIQDDQIDNEGLAQYREGQLSTTQRGQDIRSRDTQRGQTLTDTRGRRGQDIASGDRQRGQDLTDTRGRRGQDLTDTRGRRGQDLRGTGRGGRAGRAGGAAASGSGDGAIIVNPTTGKRMQLKGGQWVPVG